MLKMEIEFNEKRIERENKISINDLYKKIDNLINKLNLKKVKDGIYQDNGNEGDLTKFFVVMNVLEKSSWFRNYVIRWDWYNDRLGNICNPEPEDLMVNIFPK